MSADVCYKLFHDVGGDSNSEKNLFHNFAFIARNTPIIAFESNVTTGSYEDEFPSAGYKKTQYNSDTIKVFTLYSLEHRIPVMIDVPKSSV